ncbi:HupE / UreJ protein [Rubritalea squalenifaciens DSM 18772]|uniref:HupE / UreJ protein n=1 Tax=Rubritalea squalenifaciens DSM 18772 TaxID=1123071 RepID=A0A1M6AYD9_9BACT|nr:HupE/UreJ family protein [Rubritalea squalenifaciens]SHI41485.1 HupE / UreJ protein [Rubritalea squalenifaciens DSM 18772]
MRRLTLYFLLSLLCLLRAQAHVVEQMFADFNASDGSYQLTIRFDAGISLPEMRADKEALQPKFSWLQERSPEELARIKAETESFLHEYLQFSWDSIDSENQPLNFELSFPAWQHTPPKFEERFTDTGFAYFDVICHGKTPDKPGTLSLKIREGDYPDLAVGFPNQHILTIYPGKGERLMEQQGKVREPDQADSFLSFLDYGYRHVIPEGWDHVLFILALVCLSFAWKPLLTQSLVFTLAHTITLGLAVSGIIPPFSENATTLIEIFIAGTIAYVAIENLISKQVKTHRLTMIFLFGLIHGLGFASVLGDKIRAAGEITLPLLATNLGVELGQLSVIGITLACLFWAKQKSYFPIILKSISSVIALTGIYWVFDRIPF